MWADSEQIGLSWGTAGEWQKQDRCKPKQNMGEVNVRWSQHRTGHILSPRQSHILTKTVHSIMARKKHSEEHQNTPSLPERKVVNMVGSGLQNPRLLRNRTKKPNMGHKNHRMASDIPPRPKGILPPCMFWRNLLDETWCEEIKLSTEYIFLLSMGILFRGRAALMMCGPPPTPLSL